MFPLISRKNAKEKNETHYFTGVPCINGHISKRFTCSYACVQCSYAATKKLRLTDEQKEKERNYHIKRHFGITRDTYDEILKVQNGLCQICSNKLFLGKSTHIDHCHKTNKIRGLLCYQCNTGIGNLKHNPEWLRKAALYCEAE